MSRTDRLRRVYSDPNVLTAPRAPIDYKYKTLSKRNGAIRLLSLLPGNFEDPIRLCINEYYLDPDRPPKYEALSYAWGDPTERREIWVLEHGPDDTLRVAVSQLLVTRNLEEALRYLRYKDRWNRLWIDAISINQNDIEERSSQVQHMGDLYRLADTVIVWLGPEADDSTLGLESLWTMGSQIGVNTTTKEFYPLENCQIDDPELFNPLVPFTSKSPKIKAILSLLDRPWFTRLWIRQEIYLGRERAFVMCGESIFLWNDIWKGFYFCINRRIDLQNPDVQALHEKRLRFSRFYKPEARSFFGLLVSARYGQCSDPRDRVFSLYGMLLPEDHQVTTFLKPDYTRTVAEVYSDALDYSLKKYLSLEMLEECDGRESSLNIPTWSPDWSRPAEATSIPTQYADASSSVAAERVSAFLLRATGCAAATVELVVGTEISVGVGLDSQQVLKPLRQLLGGRDIYEPYLPEVTSESILEACSYILSCGNVKERKLGSKDEQVSLEHIRSFLECALGNTAATQVEKAESKLSFEADHSTADYGTFYCRNRTFITTSSGHIGIAPRAIKPGDIVTVLLGCPTLVALTPTGADDNTYKVLGPCYIPCLNYGETLLGPIPPTHRIVWSEHDQSGVEDGWIFQDVETGGLTPFDPRIEWDELEIDSDDPYPQGRDLFVQYAGGSRRHWKRPDTEYWRSRGMQLTRFDLV